MSHVLIVGGGTWGISIAYRLARRGFTNITVLDSDDLASSTAAGNDLNKILEEREYKPGILDDT
jgi:sarcosine oxidase/L-pipecolate oxidase